MATPNLTPQNYFATSLAAPATNSDTTIYLSTLPTGTEGYLELDEGSTAKEIIYYTSKGSNFVTLPSVLAGRGVGGTSAVAHLQGATVKMKLNAEWWLALQNGSALAASAVKTAAINNGAVTADKLGTGATTATVATSQSTGTAYATDLAAAGPSVTVTVGANGVAVIGVSSFISQNTNTAAGFVGIDISGATTLAADTDRCISYQALSGMSGESRSGVFMFTGLTPGSTTFKLKYGTSGSGTATYATRRISVVPL